MQPYGLTYLGYSQVFGQRPTSRFLELRFGSLPQIATLRMMTALAAMYYNGEATAEGAQVRLLRELGGNAPWITRACEMLAGGRLILFHDELFAGMAKMALRFAPRDDRAVGADFGARIAECALMYSELLGMEVLPKELTGTIEDLLAAELRSLPRNRDHRFGIVGRYARFIDWMRSEKPLQYGWKRSIDADFETFHGISLDDYIASCVLFGTLYSAIRDVASTKTYDPIINFPIWFHTLKDPTFIARFVDRFAVPTDDLIREWGAAQTSSLSLAALGPLWNRPLVRLDDVHVVAPLPALIYNAVGEGFYYNVFDHYDDHDKGTFSQCFGYFLQDYVREIFDAAYADVENSVVDGDVPYGKGGGDRTTDTVIFEGDDVIFVEVVGKRVNMKGAVLDLDKAAINNVLEAGVRKKLKQLHTNVEAFRAGTIFPERPRPAGQRIFVLVVTPVSYPHLYVVHEYIPRVIAAEGWLQNVFSIEIADIEEIEMFEDCIPRGLRLGTFLADKAKTNPNIPIKNMLLSQTAERIGEPAIARGAAFVDTVVERLRK